MLTQIGGGGRGSPNMPLMSLGPQMGRHYLQSQKHNSTTVVDLSRFYGLRHLEINELTEKRIFGSH